MMNSKKFIAALFIRALGLIYTLAFWSLSQQVLGLIGKNGVSPAADYLTAFSSQLGLQAYFILPSLAWINSSDVWLQGIAYAGSACGFLVLLGICPGFFLFLCWGLYLSLVSVGQQFMSFQWDILLLEAGFISIFLAPWNLWMGRSYQKAPSQWMIWLVKALLFKLMFSSGLVKLISGDPSWKNLTALYFHYETQPIPNPVSPFAHSFPTWMQQISCGAMFAIELVLPFFIWGPRILQRIAFGGFILLQALIIMTGNYAFFNLLTIALCLPLLDDADFKIKAKVDSSEKTKMGISHSVRLGIFVLISLLSTMAFTRSVRFIVEWPEPLMMLQSHLEPFRLANGYGLFAVMTTKRFEIILEGSDDREHWKEYEFKYKPGNVKYGLVWVAPHQPRLDWQMWFAALSTYRNNPWFLNLCVRMLEGRPEVLKLLDKNPFGEKPPKYIRSVIYLYRFVSPQNRKFSQAVWIRERPRPYAPIISLKGAQ